MARLSKEQYLKNRLTPDVETGPDQGEALRAIRRIGEKQLQKKKAMNSVQRLKKAWRGTEK